jgi:hypothetical protein
MTLPAIDSFDTYGGVKIDYAPVEDPETDLAASQGNQALASVAGMTHVSPRLIVQFTTSSGLGAISNWTSVFGNSFAYLPQIVQGIPGEWVMVFPATIVDFTGEEQPLNIRWAHGWVEDLNNAWTVQCKKNTSNSIKIAFFNDSGTKTDADGSQIVIVVY